MTVPTTKFPAPRQFWIMRLPTYISGKDPKYKPSRTDAKPLTCIGQSASEAREALASLQAFAGNDGSETHFIAVLRSERKTNTLAPIVGTIPTSEPGSNPEPAPKSTIPAAQMVISWDGISLKCEMAGNNGSRVKIEDVLFSSLDFPIREALEARLTVLKDRARAETMRIQRENIEYVATTKGMGIAFAQKIWPNEKIISRTLRSQLAKAGQYDPISGKIKGTEKPEKEILDLDLDL